MLFMRARLLVVLLVAALVACVQGCGAPRSDVAAPDAAPSSMSTGSPVVGADAPKAVAGDTGADAPRTVAGAYRLRIGDEIKVSFLIDATLDFSTPVTPGGTISVPLVGELMAAGRTTGELAGALEETMGEYLLDPTVRIVILGVAKQPIFVIGEVKSPGRIEAMGEMTVTRAVAAAGGILSSGRASSVMIVRTAGAQEPVAFRVDVTKVLSGRDFSDDIVLAPNDVVYVPKSVIGKVNEFVDLFFDNIAPAQLFYLRGYNMAHLGDSGWTLY